MKETTKNIIKHGSLYQRLIYLKNYYSGYSRYYRKTALFAKQSEFWSKEQWHEYQWEQLKVLIDYAYNYAPYYKALFDANNIHPQDLCNFEDYKRVPILTKDIAKLEVDNILTKHKSISKKAIPFSTSGSSGHPLSFWSSRQINAATAAYMDSQWARVGYHQNSTRVIIRGIYHKELISRSSRNVWTITTNALSKNNLLEVYGFLNKTKPDFLHAYSSSLRMLSRLLLDQNLKLDYKPKALLLGSENIYEEDRKLFETLFSCRVYSWLGLAEGTVLAGECEVSNRYHAFPGYSYVELENERIENGIKIYDLVGTSFHNLAFPFIRYKCGDIVAYSDYKCLCGRNMMILDKVIGRETEYFVTNSMQKVSASAVYSGIHDNTIGFILAYQFVQNVKGIVEVNVLPKNTFSNEDMEYFISELNLRGGNQIIFRGRICEKLETTVTGKTKFVIINKDLLSLE